MTEITVDLDDDIIETIEYCCPDHPDIDTRKFIKTAVDALLERHANREWQDDRATADDLVDLATTDKTAEEIRERFWNNDQYRVELDQQTVRKADLLRRIATDQDSVEDFLDDYVNHKVNEYAEDAIADTVLRGQVREEGMSVKTYVDQNLDQIAAQVDEEYDD